MAVSGLLRAGFSCSAVRLRGARRRSFSVPKPVPSSSDTLASKLGTRCSRSSTVWFANGPKRSIGHLLGAKKIIFLIRDIDDPAMTAASMESCRFVVLWSPRGSLGSILDMGNRLSRMRGRSHRCIHISKVLCALLLWTMICQRSRSRALWRAPSAGVCGLRDHPTSELSRRASEGRSTSEKSK